MGWNSADGTFSLPTLLPGQYRITARSANSATFAVSDVSLRGEDITDLVLTLGPSMTVTGRIIFEAASLSPPSDLTTVRVSLRAAQGGPLVMASAALNVVHADGTFQIAGVVPGQYRLMATVPGAPGTATAPDPAAGAQGAAAAWTVKSAILDGRDAIDLPFDVQPNQSISGVVVTFTDRTTELSGTIRDAAGRPGAGYYVVVFSSDKTSWVQGRRLPAPVRSTTDGKFRFAGLPAGTY